MAISLHDVWSTSTTLSAAGPTRGIRSLLLAPFPPDREPEQYLVDRRTLDELLPRECPNSLSHAEHETEVSIRQHIRERSESGDTL